MKKLFSLLLCLSTLLSLAACQGETAETGEKAETAETKTALLTETVADEAPKEEKVLLLTDVTLDGEVIFTCLYDENDHLTSTTNVQSEMPTTLRFDEKGNCLEESDVYTSVKYSYNENGDLIKKEWVSLSGTDRYEEYDEEGRITAYYSKVANEIEIFTAYYYHDNNTVQQMEYVNGVNQGSRHFNEYGKLISQTVAEGTVEKVIVSGKRDEKGRISQVIENKDGETRRLSLFTYDEKGRLKSSISDPDRPDYAEEIYRYGDDGSYTVKAITRSEDGSLYSAKESTYNANKVETERIRYKYENGAEVKESHVIFRFSQDGIPEEIVLYQGTKKQVYQYRYKTLSVSPDKAEVLNNQQTVLFNFDPFFGVNF